MRAPVIVFDLRCSCRFPDGRPVPALTAPEAAALLRAHRCGAPHPETWAQPVNWSKKPKAARDRLGQAVGAA